MLFVDDFSVFRVLHRLLAVHSPYCRGIFACKAVQHGFVDQDIVRRHTGLPRIEKLAPGNTLCRQCDVRRFVNDAGTFSAEFKRYRRQVLGRGLHDHTADGRASGKEDMIEFQSKQSLIFLRSALKYRHQAGRKGVVQHFLENGGGFCRIARGLHDGAVSRGQRGGQRSQRQLYRIIPRRHNENHTERLRPDSAAAGELGQGPAHSPGAHPAFQVCAELADLLIHNAKL